MHEKQNDAIIEEVREIRHQISARFDHDPARLVAQYEELQKQYQGRLLDTLTKRDEKDQSAA
ncbi:MAG: hypothetical protein ACJ8FY_23125 [Gemmataceae bacterium]